MIKEEEEDYDDWETYEIPDLIVLQENKERERKILDERKIMEEADAVLVENLFNSIENVNKCDSKQSNRDFGFKPIKKEKLKTNTNTNELEQKKESQMQRQRKEEKKRQNDIYGEAELDKYTNLYGSIEDKY